MPWQHCGAEVLDDQRCPTCGVSKGAWTVKLKRTRLLVVGRPDPAAADQADALEEAADEGLPFCEICGDKAPEPAADDPAAQADALEAAAESGAPFCEKCEQAA